MALKFPQNEKISKGRKNRGRKEVSSAIGRRKVNRGSIDIKKTERGRVV